MDKNARIFVAGHRGLVGSALVRQLRKQGYEKLLLQTHDELDLTNSEATHSFFKKNKPDYVFLAAAKVGGILANKNYPADFIEQNLAIQQNVITAAYKNGVAKLLFLGSSCIYPRDCHQPIRESYLLTGALEPTNRAYALAKIAGIELCWALNRQHGTQYISVMPTNLYGLGDNYHLENSHVLPALIRKMHEAKIKNNPEVVVWGTGTPLREFLFSDDLADACIFLFQEPKERLAHLFNENEPPLINIGCGEDLSIKDLSILIAKIIGFSGDLKFDVRKPDGTPRKLLDVSKMENLGWRYQTPLSQGIKIAYQDFMEKLSKEIV